MLVGRGCGAMASTGRSHMCLSSSGTEEIMGGLTISWQGRTPRPKWLQEGHSYRGGRWRLEGIIVALLTLVATTAYGQATTASGQQSSQRLTLTPLLSLGERYDDNILKPRRTSSMISLLFFHPVSKRSISPRPRPWGRRLIWIIELLSIFMLTIQARITLV